MLKNGFLKAILIFTLLIFAAPISAETIKIGIMVPTTGSEATQGQAMANAIELAAKEINETGGVLGKKLITVIGDDACDAQQGTAAASKLISENVVGVVGGYCSGATLPTLKLYGDAGIPMVIPAANSTKLIDANMGNAFQINSTGNDQSKTAVDLFKLKKIKKLAIVHQGDGYSEDLAKLTKESWEKEGFEVVAYEVANKGEQDYSAIVTNIRSKKAECVFWTAYFADGALLIKQLRQKGFKQLIAVGDGSNSQKLIDIAGKAAKGVYCFSNPTAEYLPAAKKFTTDYKAAYKSDPGPYSPLAYDGMYLLADAIKRAGDTDQQKIITALKETKDFNGITGPVAFTPKNTLAKSNFVVLVVKGKKWLLN
jgi:branched-chain amino acid transport system substrate-binding protein